MPQRSRHKHKYVEVLFVFAFTNTMEESLLPFACKDKKRLARKKKKKNIFSFLFSTRVSVRSRSQLPSVKYVYAVDYKSMIGGYRTLLVMNSVNSLLIPLRYLNHV